MFRGCLATCTFSFLFLFFWVLGSSYLSFGYLARLTIFSLESCILSVFTVRHRNYTHLPHISPVSFRVFVLPFRLHIYTLCMVPQSRCSSLYIHLPLQILAQRIFNFDLLYMLFQILLSIALMFCRNEFAPSRSRDLVTSSIPPSKSINCCPYGCVLTDK